MSHGAYAAQLAEQFANHARKDISTEERLQAANQLAADALDLAREQQEMDAYTAATAAAMREQYGSPEDIRSGECEELAHTISALKDRSNGISPDALTQDERAALPAEIARLEDQSRGMCT